MLCETWSVDGEGGKVYFSMGDDCLVVCVYCDRILQQELLFTIPDGDYLNLSILVNAVKIYIYIYI